MSIEWRKPCEHGRYEKHRMVASDYLTSFLCPGGSSVTTSDLEGYLFRVVSAHPMTLEGGEFYPFTDYKVIEPGWYKLIPVDPPVDEADD